MTNKFFIELVVGKETFEASARTLGAAKMKTKKFLKGMKADSLTITDCNTNEIVFKGE